MKLFFNLFFILFLFGSGFAQKITPEIQVENAILLKKQDSAMYYLHQLPDTEYKKSLQKIIKNNNPSYKDYYKFTSKVCNRREFNYVEMSNYINSTIRTPLNKVKIDLDYVRIKWTQIGKLRDEITIAEASKEQEKLDQYIELFPSGTIDIQKAKILSSTHQIVLYVIEKNVKDGKKICLDNLKKSRELNDPFLEILSLYSLCDFLIFEGDLDGYIKTSEESLAIEKKQGERSSYYVGTIIHLLDAYIYKGGKDQQILSLLAELYSDKNTRDLSYSLYAKFLGTLKNKPLIQKIIFNQFKVSNMLEFGKKTTIIGKKSLNPSDLYHLQRELADAHIANGFYKEGVTYMKQANMLTQKIYAKDLSNSLANYKTTQAVSKKELEIKSEKQKTSFYTIIAILVGALLLVSFTTK